MNAKISKQFLLYLSVFMVTALVIAAYPLRHAVWSWLPHANAAISPIHSSRPQVEVVFVLDTTGSMDGLLQAAKENIWSIATNMASADPAPDLKMGLVAFRDLGDEYVTKTVDLDSDLDRVYAQLMGFRAAGGGDTPESVGQALTAAVHQLSWNPQASYKTIFLVGDAPGHQTAMAPTRYAEIVRQANAKGIVINTIQAGDDSATEQQWRHLAQLNQGRYFRVEQTGSAIVMATPLDDRLAQLAQRLDETRWFYGDEQTRKAMSEKKRATKSLHEGTSPASQAKRAMFNLSSAGEKSVFGDNELLNDLAKNKVQLDELDSSKLPEPLRKVPENQRQQWIDQKMAERESIKSEIQRLTEQRQVFIQEQIDQAETVESESLDYQIYQAVRAQAAKKGLRYEAGPKY